MKIAGLRKFSLIDYPGKIAAIIFTRGCNFLCPYCHNSDLISFNKAKDDLTEKYIFDFLKIRQGKLQGVSITGGEPTLHKDLPDFISKIKLLNYKVKLDTNGTNPDMVKRLINDKLIDYIAMDIKAPIEKYEKIVNTKVNKNNILKTINLIKKSGLNYEFRTTVVKSQLSLDDIFKIIKLVNNSEKYFIQKFVPNNCLEPNYKYEETYDNNEIIKYLKTKNIVFRNIR